MMAVGDLKQKPAQKAGITLFDFTARSRAAPSKADAECGKIPVC